MKARKIILCICMIAVFLAAALFVKYQKTNNNETAAQNNDSTLSAEPETEGVRGAIEPIEEEEPEKTIPASEITMVFSGDILPGSQTRSNYDKSGIGGILGETLLTEMQNADICMINEEFPYGTAGTPMKDKQYTFRINPSYISILKDMGVDIVSLANNHTLDYGKEALAQTFDILDEAEIDYVGAGNDLKRASAWQTYDLNGAKIGILAASRVIPVVAWDVRNQTPGVFTTYDPELLNAQIAAAKEVCDFVVVYVHWGIEHKEYPEEYQRELAHGYIDAGADLVIGSHPHALQGIEYYKEKPVVYSLGNFIFSQNTDRTALLKTVWKPDGSLTLQILPASESGGRTSSKEGDAAQKLLQYMESISFDLKIDEEGIVVP